MSFGANHRRKEYYQFLFKKTRFGLRECYDLEVQYLSGGQRQCLALVMATLHRPKILLLDEHTAALDPKTSKLIMERTENLVKEKKIATLMITHNLQRCNTIRKSSDYAS